METMLVFARDTLQGKFENIRGYMEHDLVTNKGRWANMIQKYSQEIGIEQEELKILERKTLKEKIREKDTRVCEENMEEKETLKWYRRGKRKIGYEGCYRNSFSAKILAKARTNTLQVEEFIHRRNRNHSMICRLCGREEEDLKNFIITCPSLGEK